MIKNKSTNEHGFTRMGPALPARRREGERERGREAGAGVGERSQDYPIARSRFKENCPRIYTNCSGGERAALLSGIRSIIVGTRHEEQLLQP